MDSLETISLRLTWHGETLGQTKQSIPAAITAPNIYRQLWPKLYLLTWLRLNF